MKEQEQALAPELNYLDGLAVIFFIPILGTVVRIAILIGWLPAHVISNPSVGFQIAIVLALLSGAYAILRYRHPTSSVLTMLGWTMPSRFYCLAAIVGGAALSLAVKHSARLAIAPRIPKVSAVLLAIVIAPLLEESILRGLLLPLFARTMRRLGAVLATALLFAAIHGPTDWIHWFWFTICGVAYGWIRTKSESTTAAGVMHSVYNVVMLVL